MRQLMLVRCFSFVISVKSRGSKILLPQLHMTLVTHRAGERKIERRRAAQHESLNARDRGLSRLRLSFQGWQPNVQPKKFIRRPWPRQRCGIGRLS